MFDFSNNWREVLTGCLDSGNFKLLLEKVDEEYNKQNICPPREKVFAAFNLCPRESLRVVILGQDPYFNRGQAVGLAFSVNHNCKPFPPTLKNIIKEIRTELGSCAVEDGDLTPWAKQGVLLLNTCLTVREGNPLSHKDIGWDCFINPVIKSLNHMNDIVFVLWGANARKYKSLLSNPKNLVLESAHPSPLSAHNGFFGCDHFKKINEFLTSRGKKAIVF